MAEEDTPPAVPALDYSQLPALLEKLGLTPPAPPQQQGGPGQGGVGGFLGDVGKALAGGGSGLLDLSPAESDRAGAHALLGAGINMLMASGPSYVPRGLGEIIGYGLQGAQEGYRGTELATAERLAAQQAGQQQQFTNRMEAIKAALPVLTTQLAQQRLAEQARIALGGGKPGTSISDAIKPFVAANLPEGVTPAEDQIVRTVWGEANGQPLAGQQGVAAVIKNRMASSGQSAQDVIFAKNQFEPWNTARRAQLEALDPSDPQYQAILKNVVRPVMAGDVKDPTGGATHFYSPGLMTQRGQPQGPDWAAGQKPSAIIGGHNFYSLGYGGKPTTTAATGDGAAKPSQTAAAAPAGPQAAPAAPQIQVGKVGDLVAPAPPGAAPGGPTPAPQGIGEALKAPAPPVVSTSPTLRGRGAPVPPAPRQAADAILEGVKLAQATPPGGTLTAGPAATAPSAPWPAAAGAGATSYSDSPTIAAPAAATTTAPAVAPTTTAPPPSTGEPAPFTYQRQPLPADLQARVTNPLPPEQLSLLDRQVQSAVAGGNPAEIQTAQNNRATAIATARAEAVKEGEAWQQNERNKQQEVWQKKWDAWNASQVATTTFQRELAKDEASRRGASQQKVLDNLDTETTSAHEALEQLGTLRSLSQAAGQPGILNSVPQAREWLVRIGAAPPDTVAKWSAQDALDAASNRLMTVLRNGTGFQRTTNMDLGFLEKSGPGGSWTPQQFREARLAFLTTTFQHQQQYANAVHTLVASGMSLGDAQDAADKKVGPVIPQLPGNLSPDDQLRWGFDNPGRGAFYKDPRGNLKIFAPPDDVRRPE